jgi:hypothetical protein
METARHIAPRICPLCGGQFLPDDDDARHCSDACRQIAVGREPSPQQVEDAARIRQNQHPPTNVPP